jgi:hypothetical protein
LGGDDRFQVADVNCREHGSGDRTADDAPAMLSEVDGTKIAKQHDRAAPVAGSTAKHFGA